MGISTLRQRHGTDASEFTGTTIADVSVTEDVADTKEESAAEPDEDLESDPIKQAVKARKVK